MPDSSNYLAHLTSTVDSLSQGLTHAKAGAKRSLSSWVDALNASSETSLHALAKELTHLEELLGHDQINSAQVQKALTSIGQHTTKAAGKAEGATADKIRKIGELLTEGAGQLK